MFNRIYEKRKAALIEDARQKGFLGSEEKVGVMMIAQRPSPIWALVAVVAFWVGVLLITGDLLRWAWVIVLPWLLLYRQRAVLTTDRSIHVLELSRWIWALKRVKGVEFSAPLAETNVTGTAFSLRIEGTNKLYVEGQAEAKKEIAAAAEAARSRAPGPAPRV